MEKHDILHEFPEKKEMIHELKINNVHFRKLFDEYHENDHAIHRIESGAEIANDDFLTELRKKRVVLKDQIYSYLK
ncbi:MAG TPA: DUF465 domain-containing protein [Bacteroidia bacterium]|nr:DUF465 domain-containing protein [Bacteroidia bacterium]HRH09299.1 DUF465 domain-containing protein [Bacteroidia bacterium]HRH62691.1 DUF465 domain-containing protein [Bacteroidia bacterium]